METRQISDLTWQVVPAPSSKPVAYELWVAGRDGGLPVQDALADFLALGRAVKRPQANVGMTRAEHARETAHNATLSAAFVRAWGFLGFFNERNTERVMEFQRDAAGGFSQEVRRRRGEQWVPTTHHGLPHATTPFEEAENTEEIATWAVKTERWAAALRGSDKADDESLGGLERALQGAVVPCVERHGLGMSVSWRCRSLLSSMLVGLVVDANGAVRTCELESCRGMYVAMSPKARFCSRQHQQQAWDSEHPERAQSRRKPKNNKRRKP